jgi:tetrahydromethanopterin S-methyltransferase subunit G
LKLYIDNKSIDKLKERLDEIEEETSGEETDYEIEARFAKMRESIAKSAFQKTHSR